MRVKSAVCCGAVACFLAAASTVNANVLANPGFEAGTSIGGGDFYGASNWISFGNVYTTSAPNPLIAGPHSGTGALKQFGTFPGVSGSFQSFAAVAGQTWILSGFGLSASSDPMQPDNFALLKISFQNAGNTEIGFAESAFITNASPLDQWQSLTASGVAPAGTDHVNLFCLFVQPNFNGGAAFFDDISAVPAPGALALIGASGLLAARRRRA